MKKVRASAWVVMGVMAIALTAAMLSLGMGHWKSRLLPLILSCFILVLGIIELRAGIFEGAAVTKGGKTSEEKESRRILRGYLITGAWVGGFLLVIFLLGFLIAIPLLTLSYMKSHGSTWWGAIVLSIVVLGFMYLISEPLAGIELYRGLIPPYLGELIY